MVYDKALPVLQGLFVSVKIIFNVDFLGYEIYIMEGIIPWKAMVYGAETWAVKKAQERKLDVWMYGVIKMDRIRNERIG